MAEASNVTRILSEMTAGDEKALDKLWPVVYDELRALAQRSLRFERVEHTLQATALVHEAYLRLVGPQEVQWRDRAHFFSVASLAIRRILVDHARRRRSAKRGGRRARDYRHPTLR